MQKCKNWLWFVVLLSCASCAQSALADSPSKEPLKLPNQMNVGKPAVTAPAGSANLEKSFEAGFKAFNEGDVASAMSFLKPAADAGHAPSQALFAFLLDKSSFYADAVTYYRRAAEQANAEGLYGLGGMYADGSGVKQDFGEARKLFISAANNGHKQAVNVMAQAYIKGGLGLDEAALQGPEALSWIKRSAENNDLTAIDALAAAYLSGKYGLTPDPKKAEELTAKANKLRGVVPAKSGKKKSK